MKFTNKYNLPQSLFDAIVNDTYDRYDNAISVTTLINSPKISHLTKRHYNEIEVDISERIWSLFGQSTHEVVSRVSTENRIIEERIFIDTENWNIIDLKNLKSDRLYISGKSDIYDDTQKQISDYKITSVWSVIYGKIEWEYQLNCYAYFYRKLGFIVDKLQIIAILRDWSKRELQNSKNYPPIPVAIINVPLWTFEQQEKYLKERYELHQKYISVADNNIPECTPDERWHGEDIYAVMKGSNKRSTANFETAKEAAAYITSMKNPMEYRVDMRKGEDRRCIDYCSCNLYCHYWKETYEQKTK